MAEATTLRDLMRIRAANRTYLDSINGNLGTALGYRKPTGEEVSTRPAVIVFVPMKINPKWLPQGQMIPDRLEGPDDLWCHLDVVEGSSAAEELPVPRAETELAERLRGWDERVWAGSQIAHWSDPTVGSYSIGSIGAFARDKDTDARGILTNQHVADAVGTKIYHPVPWGTHIATTDRTLEHAPDHLWYGVDEPNTYVRVDCAFAPLVNGFNDLNPEIMGVGPIGPVKAIDLDAEISTVIGQRVQRVGRTTGHRKGTIAGFGYEFHDEANLTVYTDLLIIGDDDIPFSTHGDSGSLIVTDDDARNAIGLLWGGWQEELRTGYGQENWTYGIALSRILDALNLELVRE